MSNLTQLVSKMHSRWGLWLGWAVVILVAVFLRTWQLGAVPAGVHQDEAWFAYNAYLLQTTGANIYGDRWPLTVDMWGDHVSSFHSYWIVPFIAVFGLETWAFRLAFVTASLVGLALASWLLWRWTRNQWLTLFFAFLFATSQWNIIMTRASSTVVLDTMVTLIVLTVFYEGLCWLGNLKKTLWLPLLSWLGLTYGLAVFNYFTYFTSRLTLPIFLAAVLGLVWFQNKLPKKLILAGALIIGAYLIFPFAVMLRTPYALGRYQETTIINSPVVQNQIFWDISRSGQAGIPALVTRIFFNKVTENVRAIMTQYTAFYSPSVMLFESDHPIRYYVPQAGVLNYVEYFGWLLAVGALLLVSRPQLHNWRVSALVCLILTAAALIPTALTIDDFPNFQRGVYATPFWQMAAALGWGLALSQLLHSLNKKTWQTSVTAVLGLILIAGVLISALPFTIAYFGHSRYANVFNRSRAGEELGKWINAEAHDAVILMDHDEANFIYPYTYAKENVRDIGLVSPIKYILKAPEFQIGQRYYVHKLCQQEDLNKRVAQIKPEYVIAKTYPPYDDCLLPKWYVPERTFSFDDGTVGYQVFTYNDQLYQLYAQGGFTPLK